MRTNNIDVITDALVFAQQANWSLSASGSQASGCGVSQGYKNGLEQGVHEDPAGHLRGAASVSMHWMSGKRATDSFLLGAILALCENNV